MRPRTGDGDGFLLAVSEQLQSEEIRVSRLLSMDLLVSETIAKAVALIERKEVMEILQCDKKETRRLEKRGDLVLVEIGANGAHLFLKEAVMRLAAERAAKSATRALEKAQRQTSKTAPRSPGLRKVPAQTQHRPAAARAVVATRADLVIPLEWTNDD